MYSVCHLGIGSVMHVTPAFADDAAKMGEKLRLEEELKKLAQRNAWVVLSVNIWGYFG